MKLATLLIGVLMIPLSTSLGLDRRPQAPLDRIGVWSEFIPYSELETRMNEFASNRIDLFVAFHAKRADYDGFARLMKTATNAGVTIRPWLLLEEKDGYWFNKWNVDKNSVFAHRFLDEMKTRDVRVDWLIFDLEPPHDLIVSIQRSFENGNIRAAIATLREAGRNRSLFAAQDKTRSLVEDLHARGVKVHAVTTNFVLNDGKSQRIQNALGLPLTNVPFDEISFMVYRPELAKILGNGLGSKIVEIYAARARKMFGENTAIDLGEAGFVPFPLPFQGFREPRELQEDVAAVRAAGLSRIHVYSLDGMSELGLSTWLAPTKTKPLPMIDIKANVFVKAISFLRNFLPEPF